MNYEKIVEQTKLQENLKIQEAKYCEQIMNMLELLGETESVEFLKSLPSHLQEATLKKQATQMYNKIEQILESISKVKKRLAKVNIVDKKNPSYVSPKDKNVILERIRHIEDLAEKTKEILENSEFKAWCKNVDGNSNIFGGKKHGATGPSRNELGV